MAEEEVGLRLALKNRREVERGVDAVGDGLHRTGDEADRVNRKARIAAGGMLAFGKSGRLAGRAVVAGTGAAVAGLVGAGIVLTKLSKDSIGEAREAQKVGAVTRAEIKATGRAAHVSARQVGDLSGAISEKVGIDDEAIQSGANMILTFKNVRNEVGKGNKIFNRATRSAVDLSAAGFGSITSQSKTLAKALNDPVKGLAALGKSGVTFTQSQQDSIKAMVKQGNLLGAQKVILGEVEAQVGGVAAKQATWGEKASVSIGNIKESIGTALLPSLDKAEKWFVTRGTPVLNDWVGVFEKRGVPAIEKYAGVFESRGIPAMKKLVDEGRPLVSEILPAAGTFLGTAADAFETIAPKAEAVFKAFNGLPDWAKSAIAIGAGSAVIGKKLGAGSLVAKGGALGAVGSGPTPVYVTNPGFGGTGVGGVGGAPGRGGKPAVPGVAGLGGGLGATVLGLGFNIANSESAMHPNGHGIDYNNIGGEGDFLKATQARRKAGFDAWMKTVTEGGRKFDATTRGMVAGLDHVDGRIGKAKTSTAQLFGALTGVERPWRPSLEVPGLDATLSKAHSLSATLFGLPALGSYGNGLGVMAPKTNSKKPKTKPRAPFPAATPPKGGDFFGRASAAPRDPIHVHMHVGSREIADVVLDEFGNQMARK